MNVNQPQSNYQRAVSNLHRSDPVFAPVDGTDAEMFIQWKGTDVCLDFHCPCGKSTHFDGMFAHFLRCPCGAVYELGTQVRATRVEDDLGDDPMVKHLEEDDDHRPFQHISEIDERIRRLDADINQLNEVRHEWTENGTHD